MLTRFKYFIICFLLVLFSCKEKVQQKEIGAVIAVNPYDAKEEIHLSEIADSVKYIKLETSPDCVLGRLHSIIIRKQYIYAWDISQQTIFVFNKEGKFISKLDKQGRGPDEYLHIGAVFIDEDEKYVDIINSISENSGLMRYSNISFNLLKKKPMPRISANSCRQLEETYYFATQQIENIVEKRNTNAGIIVVKNGEVKGKLFEKQIITNNSSFSPFCESFALNSNNELYVTLMYDNTFYKLRDTDAIPVFTIDFGKYEIDNTIGLKSLQEQIDYLKKINGLASFPVLNIDTPEIMAFSYYLKQDSKERLFRESDFRQYVWLKKSNKVLHAKFIKNNLTDFPEKIYLSSYFFQVAHEVWHEDYLVDVILPQFYFSTDDETKKNIEGLGQFTIEDNPIIVLMKLKKEIKS